MGAASVGGAMDQEWDSAAEAKQWWLQAENDLGLARIALREAYYHQVCFIAHQAAEKSVKAVGYHLGDRTVLGHSVVVLLDQYQERSRELARLRPAASVLDIYYFPSRYPSGLPGGVPFESFTESQAQKAVKSAEAFVQLAAELLGRDATTQEGPSQETPAR